MAAALTPARDPVDIFSGLLALLFAGLGIWLGRRLARRPAAAGLRAAAVEAPPVFVRDNRQLESTGITPRELQVLELIAEGLGNKEIAARVHIGENAVKTHSGRLFDKLGVRRRMQAVQRARALRLIA